MTLKCIYKIKRDLYSYNVKNFLIYLMWDIINHRINIVKYIYIKKKKGKREKKNLQVEVNVDLEIKKITWVKEKKGGGCDFSTFPKHGRSFLVKFV